MSCRCLFLRHERLLKMMTEMEKEHAAAPLLVPCDGDCLVWSVLLLLSGCEPSFDFSKPEYPEQLEDMRQELSCLWLERKSDPVIQLLFHAVFNYDHELADENRMNDSEDSAEFSDPGQPADPGVQAEEAPATPVRNRERAEAGSTPPRPSPPPKVRRADGCRPVPSVAPRQSNALEDAGLKGPGQRAPNFLEAPVPDLAGIVEDKFHAEMMVERPTLEPTTAVDDIEESMLENSDEEKAQNRKKRRRGCQKKVPTLQENKERALLLWMADQGLSYHVWLAIHRQHSTYKKSAHCIEGGWNQLKCRLMQQKEVGCPVPTEHFVYFFTLFVQFCPVLSKKDVWWILAARVRRLGTSMIFNDLQ